MKEGVGVDMEKNVIFITTGSMILSVIEEAFLAFMISKDKRE